MTSARLDSPAPLLPERLTSLDGLRGVAALVVLVHHALLTVPLLARAYYTGQPPVPERSLAWWLTYTPLHLVWAGGEAVVLFFVLSGLVVTLPALRSARFDWVAFYPRRVVRIYGPAACALALGVVLILVVPRFDSHVLGHWMNLRPSHVKASDVVSDLMLVQGSSGIVSPLWSLQWEILFSAFLPLFVGIAVLGRRRPRTVAALVAAALVLGSLFQVQALFYLALFAVGALLVVLWDRVVTLGRRLSRRGWVWPLVVAVGVIGTTSMWWSQGLGLSLHRATLMRWTTVPGIVLLLLAAALWRPAVRVLDTRLLQWLGRISFSLYLVHEPIVIAARFLLVHLHAPTWASIAVAIPVAIGAAELFARFVEAPFHRLARRAGRFVAEAARDVLPSGRPRLEAVPRMTGSIPVVVRAPEHARPLARGRA